MIDALTILGDGAAYSLQSVVGANLLLNLLM